MLHQSALYQRLVIATLRIGFQLFDQTNEEVYYSTFYSACQCLNP